MPTRRGSRRGGRPTATNRRGASGGIRKNTRSRQAPSHLGHTQEPESNQSENEESLPPASDSDQDDPSEYHNTPSSNTQSHTLSNPNRLSPPLQSPTSIQISEPEPSPNVTRISNEGITLHDMRELLRSQEDEIVDRILLRLRSQNKEASTTPLYSYPAPQPAPRQQPPPSTTLSRIAELQSQLAQLQAEAGQLQVNHPFPMAREPGTYNPILPLPTVGTESASALGESVEALFPGVERSTLTQIIENRFKPTNIYRLLATEKDRAESQRTINIGGVEFEQAEQDGKESEYRMSNFFKAWAAYSGILVKLAPYAIQGELATALFIYTMNLYYLLEKYTWDGVKGYHFQFHRKRVASGQSIYLPQDWRQIDSELIASKCFSHPAQKNTWNPTLTRPNIFPQRLSELPLREYQFGPNRVSQGVSAHPYATLPERRQIQYPAHPANSSLSTPPGPAQSTPQACRNWNYRDCRTVNCRHLHMCITCGNSHKLHSVHSEATQTASSRKPPAATLDVRPPHKLYTIYPATHPVKHFPHTPLLHNNYSSKLTSTQVMVPAFQNPRTPMIDSENYPTRLTVSKQPPRPNTTLPYSVFTYHETPMPAGQLRHEGWRHLLAAYPEPVVVEAILDICQYGARIGHEGHRGPGQIHPNLKSAEDSPETISTDIAKELANERFDCYTSLSTTPEDFVASPLGLADMADGSKRRIHHLSCPADDRNSGSINGSIPEHYATISYSSIDHAISAIQCFGKGCLLVKRDFESAFRHIPVTPIDRALLGFHWENMYYAERYLPFGLRTAPFLFNLFAETFHWILGNELEKENLPAGIIHYLDDFLIVLPSSQNPESYSSKFSHLCSLVGLKIKVAKNEEGKIASFGGVELDTNKMVIRLPSKKLEKARTIIESAHTATSLSLIELQRITGFLNFVTVVVPLGRTFLRRLYNMELHFPDNGAQGRNCRRRITREAHQDLKWWQQLLASAPERSIQVERRDIVALWSDASGTKGLGAFYTRSKITGREGQSSPNFNPETRIPMPSRAFSISLPRYLNKNNEHINTKEMRAVEQALLHWGKE